MSEAAYATDKRPLIAALVVILTLTAIWLLFNFFGEQRYHNTSVWQSLRPVQLTSPPQTATPVEVRDEWRNALTVVQTERGLYFLSGTRHVPAAGASVVIQANDHWEIYMCLADGSNCMAIHSFCAGAVWPQLPRDEQGRAANCYAPYYGDRPAAELEELPPQPERRAGPGKRRSSLPPPAGISHPRTWAAKMGLPVAAAAP